jgi:hypothetical protein
MKIKLKTSSVYKKTLNKEIARNDSMTRVVLIIKRKIQNLPCLHLPGINFPFVLEIDSSDEVCIGILLQKHTKREQICMYEMLQRS